MSTFQLRTKMRPKGDQPQAIKKLTQGFERGLKEQVLLGVTGSGKTFTMANVIQNLGRPTLVLSHNKTLAAQLYAELKDFFPDNAVEYFVSYYDYYQPEAYLPHSDTYIEKDASINDDLDRLRLAATSAVLSREDCIIVSSVSCIYGLGSPEDWKGLLIQLSVGDQMDRDALLTGLIEIQYERVESELTRGTFRVRGSRVDLYPSYGRDPYRVEFQGDQIVRISVLAQSDYRVVSLLNNLAIYPAKHFVTTPDKLERAIDGILFELAGRVKELIREGKELEAKRIQSRTDYDVEMLREVGYCSGIENYSRHISGRAPGASPYTLIDYFPKNFLMMIDESHQSIPQIRGMFHGDHSRKKMLVAHGFRLPSALDNRPLKFPEFEKKVGQLLYVSATPGPYEMDRKDQVVEQIIRPTGLLDPEIDVRKTENQIDDLVFEIKERSKKKQRILVSTLTKKMAEDLSRYLREVGIHCQYLHSELDAFERVQVLKDLRTQKYDVVVGVNLLREGLDLPEVSLVVVLDADKEGFLRSDVSLIQTAGRAARHVNGKVIFYADKKTDAIKKTVTETLRRRRLQKAHNQKKGIRPASVNKEIRAGIERYQAVSQIVREAAGQDEKEYEVKNYLVFLKKKMEAAAKVLEFDKAARYRDEIRKIEGGDSADRGRPKGKRKKRR